MSRPTPVLVVHGDLQHGVAIHAGRLAREVRRRRPDGAESVAVGDLPGLADGVPLHLQFTDRLWGTSAPDAAATVTALAARHPLTLTLHDLPQPSDGRGLGARVACYRAVTAAARAVACSSDHERDLLAEHTDDTLDPVVIPLPVGPGRPPTGEERGRLDGDVAVLGFYYPGKGHDEALAVAAELGLRAVTVLGRASPGHEAELAALVARGADLGVRVEVTGYLPDAELLRRARRVGVPLLAHQHLSASGSLGAWIEAGRRPVALAGRYTLEQADLRPGTLTLADRPGLAGAVRAALDDPDTTWVSTAGTLPFGWDVVAGAHLAWWDSL